MGSYRCRAGLLEQPIHHKRVQNKNQSDDRLRQLDLRVLVIVPARGTILVVRVIVIMVMMIVLVAA